MSNSCCVYVYITTTLAAILDRPMKKLLLIKRREIIPADPKLATDIDTGLPAFLLDGVECMVKGDQVFQDGRRILLFSTDEHLQILARAREILGDGTFRITPHL